ncbi:hypothetical protein Cthiooxydans_14540 [Comamonas thiooxydans]|nr:hypothetical protein Cthiooxydans_14540 [Comamonas thiooxydans]
MNYLSVVQDFIRIPSGSILDGNQHAYIESFNSRFREECLNEHWFTSLAHARVIVDAWRREYNEELPKKVLVGLTPAAYAQRLMHNPLN